ncbi:peptidoglycan-binding domain-containing protein [Sulfitobacter geojensis]|uniref:peptidoglycan-binding domain-containing protein n=1 Tax=Sulfitobacter geojensis TaxID=1342299 RepID=UPI0036DA9523
MAEKLSGSVGKGGKNNAADVTIVQKLLNPFAGEVGFAKLKTDGSNSKKLEAAIGDFQTCVCKFRADGRVDPGKNTIKKLNAGVAKAKSEKKAEEKREEKAKEDQRQQMKVKMKKQMEAEAKAQKVPPTMWETLWGDIEKKADSFYDTYIASAQKKGDAPSKAAPKISEMCTKEMMTDVKKELKKIDTGGTLYPGRVEGKTSGVNKKIIDILTEVSSHYEGTTIKVVSGLRNKAGQASAMYNGWAKHLNKYGKNGDIYWFVRQSKYQDLWKELDDFHAAKNKAGFVKCMKDKAPWGSVSRHMTGQAVDISTSTDKKIIKALGMCMRYLAETDGNSEGIKCHHFDDKTGLVWPIPESLRKKFP